MTNEYDVMPLAAETKATTTQFLDEAGTRQFATKTKEYADSRTAHRITNVVVGTDVIDITIDTASGGGVSQP